MSSTNYYATVLYATGKTEESSLKLPTGIADCESVPGLLKVM
jgi:hypothetical protein